MFGERDLGRFGEANSAMTFFFNPQPNPSPNPNPNPEPYPKPDPDPYPNPPKHKRIADELPSPKRPIAETSHSVIQHYATNVVPSKRPKDNSSYDTLVRYQSDITMKVKLQVFEDMAHNTNMFFSAFQMDGPMVPFQYSVV